jgi:hypothetical protein
MPLENGATDDKPKMEQPAPLSGAVLISSMRQYSSDIDLLPQTRALSVIRDDGLEETVYGPNPHIKKFQEELEGKNSMLLRLYDAKVSRQGTPFPEYERIVNDPKIGVFFQTDVHHKFLTYLWDHYQPLCTTRLIHFYCIR